LAKASFHERPTDVVPRNWEDFWRTASEKAEKERQERYECATPEERVRIDAVRHERAIDCARPRVKVPALRTDAWTGVEREVEITLVIRPSASRPDEQWLFIDDGGVTGYESMRAERIHEIVDDTREGAGWCACMGTKERWDKLFVPASSLRKAIELLKE